MTQASSSLLNNIRVVIKGAGDLATGVGFRLWRAGFPVVMTELTQPLAIRRAAVFAEAVYAGATIIEGIEARRIERVADVEAVWQAGAIPVLVDATRTAIAALRPEVIVDGIMAKRNTGTQITDAPLVIALGPGFVAGHDVHAVIETSRGHFLGRVIWTGAAQEDTGVPGEVGGQSRKRVVYPPRAGIFLGALPISAQVREGDLLGTVDGAPVLAPASGVLRGLIHDGLHVTPTLKIGDVDPRGVIEHCFTVSDKALAIGGGVLEAVVAYMTGRHTERVKSTMPSTIRQQRGLDAIKPYVPGKPIEEVQREYGLTDVIKLASNENPLGPSPKVVAALEAALLGLNFYPDAQAYSLSRAIAARHEVAPDMVRIGNGADGLIRELCVSYLNDDDEVLTSVASFPVYDISTAVMRARMVKTPLKDLRFDLNALAAAITERTKLIFLCNPNNPTGNIVTADEVAEFMSRVPGHVIVAFDEAYYEFVDSPEYPDSLAYVKSGHYPNVVVLRTFSKAYGIAGIRLGYGIAQPALLAPMRASTESFPVNRLAQIAGLAALKDNEFMARTIAVNAAGRTYLYQEFQRLGLAYTVSHTNFVLLHIGPRANDVFQKLLERGIIVRPCTAYQLPEYLRITVGAPAQNERFVKALEDILKP